MSAANSLFPAVRRRPTSGAVRRALRANEISRKTLAGFPALSFRQPSAAADCALIGAETGAMRNPLPVGEGQGWGIWRNRVTVKVTR